jgi:hypothetical protein
MLSIYQFLQKGVERVASIGVHGYGVLMEGCGAIRNHIEVAIIGSNLVGDMVITTLAPMMAQQG